MNDRRTVGDMWGQKSRHFIPIVMDRISVILLEIFLHYTRCIHEIQEITVKFFPFFYPL